MTPNTLRPRDPIEDRDAFSLARHWSGGYRHGAYDRLQSEAMSDPDAADFLAAGVARFAPADPAPCVHPTCETPAEPSGWHVGADAVGHYRTTSADLELERRARLAGIWPADGEGSHTWRKRARAILAAAAPSTEAMDATDVLDEGINLLVRQGRDTIERERALADLLLPERGQP